TQKSLERFGFGDEASDRKWENFDDRFDVSKTPNEGNRFGYIVEFDPFNPESTPIKHSATGRFKHEAGNIHITDDGTVVCYSGDASRVGYSYTCVSSKTLVEVDLDQHMSLLDNGTLLVAGMEANSPEEELDRPGVWPEDGALDGPGSWK